MGGKKALWKLFLRNIPRILSITSTTLIIITELLILIENQKAVARKAFELEGNSCGFVEYVCGIPPLLPPQYRFPQDCGDQRYHWFPTFYVLSRQALPICFLSSDISLPSFTETAAFQSFHLTYRQSSVYSLRSGPIPLLSRNVSYLSVQT
jgi:hypothetical protein